MRRRAFLGRGLVGLLALRGIGAAPAAAPARVLEAVEPSGTLRFISTNTMVASGGFCAPMTPYYDLSPGESPVRWLESLATAPSGHRPGRHGASGGPREGARERPPG